MVDRFRDESGFGLLELLIALVILNVGLFAIVGAFNGATVAMARAGQVSAATAVADKQMEIYRGLQNCAIWLDTSAGSTYPAIGTGSAYQADGAAYSNVAFIDKSQSGTAQALLPWSTSYTSQAANAPWNGDIPTSCNPTPGTTPPTSSTQAIQTINGPDGAAYPVYTYIILTQPANGTWVKQITIVVRSPTNSAKILARETSVFDPLAG